MSTQAALFDAKEGDGLKRQGMERAQSGKNGLLRIAREIAIEYAQGRESREATIDSVYWLMAFAGQDPTELGNAAGSVFDGPRWEFTGRWVKSKRVSNHGRMIRVWRLRCQR